MQNYPAFPLLECDPDERIVQSDHGKSVKKVDVCPLFFHTSAAFIQTNGYHFVSSVAGRTCVTCITAAIHKSEWRMY